jgi:hypothetical protein
MHSSVGTIVAGLILLFLITPISALEILPAGEIYVNDEITVRGLTNYNEENNILVEVFPASFWPTNKYNSTIMGGTSGIVPVLKITNSSMNTWSFTFSTVEWDPDLYMIRTEVLGKKSVQTETFELLAAREKEILKDTIPDRLSRNETDNDGEKQSNDTQSVEQVAEKNTDDIPYQAAKQTPMPIWLPIIGVLLVSLYLLSWQEKK